MALEFISPVGRFVQGSLSLETKIDPTTQKPKLDEKGEPIKECFIAIAIRKDDPHLPAFYAQMVAQARADFPHLFDKDGNCLHPKFAWKMQDGDGVDSNGQSVKDKPGFAGHYIFKMGTRYLPKCFHAGKYDPTQQIPNPAEVIKRGYYIRVAGQIRGNGVTPQDRTQVPGLFISPNLVELVAYYEEIVGGPDANKVFGAAPLTGLALPPGASATPLAPAGAAPLAAPSLPPLPGATMPALPGAAPAPMGMPPLPGTAPLPPPMTVPQYQMTASAMGNTREALLAQGWTDEKLLEAGHMVRVA